MSKQYRNWEEYLREGQDQASRQAAINAEARREAERNYVATSELAQNVIRKRKRDYENRKKAQKYDNFLLTTTAAQRARAHQSRLQALERLREKGYI